MNMLLRRALLTLCYLFVSSFGVIYTDSSAFAMTAEQNSVITCPDDVPDSSAQLTDALAVCNYKQELWQGQESSFIDGKYADNTNQSQAAGVTTPNNLPSTAWWTVAYQVVINNNWEIETSRANQNSQKRLTDNAFNDLNPSFNFGATKLAFESDRDGNAEIYTMNSDGTNQVRITADNAQDRIPEWSPVADKILFVSRRDGNDEIYLMQSDGTNQSRLTVNASPDTFPVWSPNGNEIAWVQTNGNYGVIWLMNADGSNQRAISPSLLYLSHVTWSPDGGRIAFDYDSDQDGLNRIATIRTDGSELQDVDATPGYPTTLNDHWAGNWTPDGGSILYTDVQLMISGNQIIIASTIIRSICIDTQKCYSFDTTYNLFSLAPDIENSDPFPPVSSVRQFGPYTRAQQFAVEWKGTDVGPAGIGSYDLQYRSEQDLSWRSWLTDTYLTRDTPPNVTTGKWYFQSRAKDTIGNLETWPTGLQGDTSTTLYAWNKIGRAHV